jgi:hypothetical protein
MLVRVDDPADPERCQGRQQEGQCMFRVERDQEYCAVHLRDNDAVKIEDFRLYHLAEARDRKRLAELTENDPVLALREIIALGVRLTEKRVNLIQSDAEFLEAYRDLNTLQLTVMRLKKSAHSIENNLGALCGKPTVLRFGQHIIHIVVEELQALPKYEEIVQRIADQTIQAIATANNHSEPTTLKIPSLVGRPKKDAKTFLIQNVEDQVRLAELSKHERIKSLNEEISLQIVIVEKRWNLIKTPADLISACGPLSQGLRVLETQIKAAHEIEQTLGNLLNHDTLRRLGQKVSEIITDELELAKVPQYEAVTDRIMDRIASTPFNRPARITAQ